jgi:hypothetical protein
LKKIAWFLATLLIGIAGVTIGLIEMSKGFGDPFWPTAIGIVALFFCGISAHEEDY